MLPTRSVQVLRRQRGPVVGVLNPFFPGLLQRVGVPSPAPVGQSGGWSVQVLLPPDAVQRLGADPSRLLGTRPLAGVDRSRQRTEGPERLIPLRSQTRPGQSCPGQRQQPHRQGGDESKQHGIPEITIIRLYRRSGRRPSPCPRPAAGATERLQCALPCCGAAAQPRQPPPLPSLAPAGHPSATGRALVATTRFPPARSLATRPPGELRSPNSSHPPGFHRLRPWPNCALRQRHNRYFPRHRLTLGVVRLPHGLAGPAEHHPGRISSCAGWLG